MAEPLTLMAVHAHPDDEASGGGILAAYADQGIRTVVVTCTNGEFGDAPGGIKPGQDGHDEEGVARQRLAELEKSAGILKVSNVETLGYRDSGMVDWEYKSSPEAFSNVPLDVVAGRIGELAAVLGSVAVARARHGRQRPGRQRPGAGGPVMLSAAGGPVVLAAAGAGVIDVVANICYVAATRTGMFGLAVVLASLYPGVTVLLARVVLGERLRWVQRAGLGLAVIGIILVTT